MTAYDTSPFLPALPPGHPFPVGKYRRLRDAVQRAGLPVQLRAAPGPDLGWVLAVHDADYVKRVLAGTLTAAEQRRLGLPWSRALAERALRICGAAVAACQDALDLGVGLVLGGGGHHADRASGRGFCVFNDLAVAARWARANGVGRVLVADCDVHQGDGTASLLRDDPRVFTLSVHAAGNRPFGPVGSDLDVALPDGCGDLETWAPCRTPCAGSWGNSGRSWCSTWGARTLCGATGWAGWRCLRRACGSGTGWCWRSPDARPPRSW